MHALIKTNVRCIRFAEPHSPFSRLQKTLLFAPSRSRKSPADCVREFILSIAISNASNEDGITSQLFAKAGTSFAALVDLTVDMIEVNDAEDVRTRKQDSGFDTMHSEVNALTGDIIEPLAQSPSLESFTLMHTQTLEMSDDKLTDRIFALFFDDEPPFE